MHTHEDSFECVREMFNLCREPSIRPFVSDDLFEMVSSPRKLEGMNEWGIRVDAFVGILEALVSAKQSGRLPIRFWEAARKAQLWHADIERRGGIDVILKDDYSRPPEGSGNADVLRGRRGGEG